MKLSRSCLAVCVSCLGIAATLAVPPAAAQSPAAVVTLALADGKAVFHRGEIIPLTAVFKASKPGLYDLNTDPGNRNRIWNSDSFQCDAPAATDPLPVFYDREFGMSYNGPGPRFEPLTKKPILIPFTLNEWLRFETPGRYRVALTSRRLASASKRHDELFFRGSVVTSNSVEFTVLPDDPAWDVQTLQEALPQFSKVETGYDYDAQQTRSAAARVIRFLGTSEAGRAMVARYGTFTEYESLNSPAYFETMLGLYGFPDRGFIIKEMQSRLTSSDFPVASFFLNALAETQFLAAYPNSVPPYDAGRPAQNKERQTLTQQRLAAHEAFSAQARAGLAAAVSKKTGRAKATSIFALLRTNYHRNSPGQRALAQALVPIFDALAPEQQEYLLDENGFWPDIRGPEMLPILRRLYAEPPSTAEPGGIQYDEARQRRSAILRHLAELSPSEGRTLLLAEIKNAKTQVDLPTLCSLPDKTLPSLDAVLVGDLERGADNGPGDAGSEARLVECYVSAAMLPRLKRLYKDNDGEWDCEVQSNLLAYFERTDPGYAAVQMRKALATRTETGCYRSVLSDVAALRYGPDLEHLAIAHLHDPDPQTAADAAKTLGEYGSPAAEAALWARMREWHREWAGKAVQLAATDRNPVPVQGQLEYALTFALAVSPQWLLDLTQLQTLDSLCVTSSAKQNIESFMQHWADPVVITSGGGRDDWMLLQFMSLPSFGALESKLSQFPRGTRFVLSRTNFMDEAEQAAAFKRLAPFLRQRKMQVTVQGFPVHSTGEAKGE